MEWKEKLLWQIRTQVYNGVGGVEIKQGALGTRKNRLDK